MPRSYRSSAGRQVKRRYGLHGKRVMDYFACMRSFEAGATSPSAGMRGAESSRLESVGRQCSMDHGHALGLTAPAAGPLRRRPYRDSETVQRRPRNGSENLEAGSSLEGRQAKRPNGFHGHRGMVYGHARSDILHACGRSKRVGPSSHDSNL